MNKKLGYERRWKKDDGRKTKEDGFFEFVLHPSSFIPRTLILSYILFFLISAAGCDAFVRKFTRKPKKENLPELEMVLAPEEYQEARISKEDLYYQYFSYWKSWQDELILSLSAQANHKKQMSCAKEAIRNLEEIRALLKQEQQAKIDVYISQMRQLNDSIAKDVYGYNVMSNRQRAELIRMNILRGFSYKKISKDISP